MRDYNTIIESGEFVFKTIRRHKRPTGHPGTAQAKPLVSQSLQQQNRVAHWRDTSSNGKEAGASGPAAWERTQSIISKTLRIKSKQRSEEQNKLDSLITQSYYSLAGNGTHHCTQ
ncbi:hypothetical protein ACTFIZ_004134 [Dictyostelium cf. discoideum]